MKCYICDRDLSDKEIVFHDGLQKWEPCGTCLTEIYDAAFKGQFKTEDDEYETVEDGFDDAYYEELDVVDPTNAYYHGGGW